MHVDVTASLKPWKTRVIRLVSYAIGAIVFVAMLFAYQVKPKLLNDLEGRLLDLRFQLRGPTDVTNQVALVAVDEESLAAYGRWPWPRARSAELIQGIHDAGAAVVGLDIIYSEPETAQTLAQLEPILDADPKLAKTLHQRLASQSGDQLLAETLRNTGNVVNGHFFFTFKGGTPQKSDAELEQLDRLLASSAVELVRSKQPEFSVVQAYGVTPNIPLIADAGPGAGYFNFPPGADGLVRVAPLVMRYRDRLYPSLALKTLAHLLQEPILVNVADYGIRNITLGDFTIPTDEYGAVILNFRGRPGTIPTYSAATVLDGTLPPRALADKIVILGVTAVGVYDAHSTSFGPAFPGPEIQSTLLDNLIAGDSLQQTNLQQLVDVLTMAILITLLAAAFPRIKQVVWQNAFGFTLILIYMAINYWLFASYNTWINMIYPLVAWAITFATLAVFFGVIVERRFGNVREAFRSYLHPALVEQLTYRPELLQFGGESKELTILFSDVRGFTEKSESITPQELAEFLRCYMDPMTEIVFKNRGTLDKYIGDAVMAFYGAPFPSAVHPQRACRTALQMLEALDHIFDSYPHLLHLSPVKIGIGIHTGLAAVGNFGSTYRFSYTVLGDSVNLASRLEGLCKRYGTEVVVSETTYARVKEEFLCRELDQVRVKGKQHPITIYQLLAEIGLEKEEYDWLPQWHEALVSYKQRNFEGALVILNQLHNLRPEDKAVQLYIARALQYAERPPPADWDGTYTYTEK